MFLKYEGTLGFQKNEAIWIFWLAVHLWYLWNFKQGLSPQFTGDRVETADLTFYAVTPPKGNE